MGGFEDPYAQMLPGNLYDQDLGALGVDIQEGTENTDNAVGEQEVFAGYLMGDVPLGLGFRATTGARLERSKQSVRSFALFSSTDEAVVKTIDNIDLLPSGMLTYEIMDGMLVRVGYGRTLNRPDFREMSPVCFYAYVGGGDVCGAPETVEDPETGEEIPYTLKRTVIHNVDARWEWYFSETESLSLGVFYKQFEDPIETVFFLSGGSTGTQFVNAKAAHNYGLELDFIKNFGFISPPLGDFYVAGNLTFVRSEIELYDYLAQFQDNEKRPLQGQSPYILNAQIGYNNVDIGSTVTLLYNVYGERLSAVGANGRPNVYEQPYHQLDFVAKQKLGAGFELGFKANNLIDLPHKFIQGGNISRTYRKGRSFSLSLSWAH
jgi:TonB-dependent receptor